MNYRRVWVALLVIVTIVAIAAQVADGVQASQVAPQPAWPMINPVAYVAPTATATPDVSSVLPSYMFTMPLPVTPCMTCYDYGNTGSTGTGKGKVTYPYLLTETRTKNGHTYIYTRWVLAPPTKATKTP